MKKKKKEEEQTLFTGCLEKVCRQWLLLVTTRMTSCGQKPFLPLLYGQGNTPETEALDPGRRFNSREWMKHAKSGLGKSLINLN